MASPVKPSRLPTPCPVCHEDVHGIEMVTEELEQYMDGVGTPNDPRRIPTRPARRMVPGATTTRYLPCGHEVTR